jgi:hypothetical protein
MVILGVLTVPLSYWLRRTSELGALLQERLQTLGNPLAFFDEIGKALSQVTGRDAESESAVNLSSSNIVTEILSVLTPVVSATLIFLIALVFNLIYHRDIQSGMLLLFQSDSGRQMAKDILKDIQVNTSIYFGTLTVVNIGLGIAATVLTWLVGLPHPFLWGMLAAVLNFIVCGCRDRHRDALRHRPPSVSRAQSCSHRAARLSRHNRSGGAGHHADPHRSSAHDQSIPGFPLHRNLELGVGTGRRVPGRTHSFVRDGGAAAAVIDGGMPPYTCFCWVPDGVRSRWIERDVPIGTLRYRRQLCPLVCDAMRNSAIRSAASSSAAMASGDIFACSKFAKTGILAKLSLGAT